ncbi:MAG: HAMP domain-containing histidine kinase [Selenomonadaceae bacterium]|nr:HAMP domain-containing histidine kinase [Selenomonadaceae bacterium]
MQFETKSPQKISVKESFMRQRRFVNDVSHELRTPLTIICGYIDMLERYGLQDPEIFKEAVSSIKLSARNMQKLVEGLLFLARADQGNQPLMKFPVELDEVLKNFVEAYPSPRLQISKLVPCKILADTEFLNRMFAALIDNALKYSPPDSVVNIEMEVNGKIVTLKFIDQGIGIAKEDCEKIFDRFYRTDKARTKVNAKENSVGLGLSIAKWIAEHHDIKISVQSEPGEGSTFILTCKTCE